MAIQILKSLHQISHKTFQFSRDVTGHLSHNFNHLSIPAETKADSQHIDKQEGAKQITGVFSKQIESSG